MPWIYIFPAFRRWRHFTRTNEAAVAGRSAVLRQAKCNGHGKKTKCL